MKTEDDRNDSYRSAGAFTGSGDLGRGPHIGPGSAIASAEIKTEEDRNDSYRSAGACTGPGDLGRGPGDSAGFGMTRSGAMKQDRVYRIYIGQQQTETNMRLMIRRFANHDE